MEKVGKKWVRFSNGEKWDPTSDRTYAAYGVGDLVYKSEEEWREENEKKASIRRIIQKLTKEKQSLSLELDELKKIESILN